MIAMMHFLSGLPRREPFAHDFDHVVNMHPEDDTVYGLPGMHEIREKVGR